MDLSTNRMKNNPSFSLEIKKYEGHGLYMNYTFMCQPNKNTCCLLSYKEGNAEFYNE